MAGHSKWANIKHRKERSDAKRGKAFTRAAKEIISAVKAGGADRVNNPKLRLAIQRAKDANFPNDSIDRNIKKASSSDQADFLEMTYELYGHGGVGIICECMTDNKNRIASDMRIATNKRGGNIANPGAVSFNFDRKGILQVAKEGVDEDALFEAASNAGADDFDSTDELFLVFTDPKDLYSVKEGLEAAGYKVVETLLEYLPKVTVACNAEDAEANRALMDWLDNLDDVDAFYHNMEE